ncbi:aryl-sulfate sulfotransferase [Ferrimonas pelagia]|uniref:Aryl-sulfate sulfotransferase n=1 Tax=Ferrimonas pelagia TaxID=1177826 RepID=A0ABP9EUD5_9GAMM
MKRLTLSLTIVASLGLSVPAMSASFPSAPSVGTLGYIEIDPYGNSPLTALIDLNGKVLSDVSVRVHGKPNGGVDISYPVGKKALLQHDGVPIFGLYPDYRNTITVDFTLDGKKISETYQVMTSSLVNKHMDSRNITALQEIEVKHVEPGFEDRLYLNNSHTYIAQGTDLHWAGRKSKSDKEKGAWMAAPAQGAASFDSAPVTYIVDTQGEYRWWLDPDATYDSRGSDIGKRGYLMGMHEVENGQFTWVQGQDWGYFNMLGQVETYKLPRGYVDGSHEVLPMGNGNVLVRAAKRNYLNPEGDVVMTVRDHILELDARGHLVDTWVLPEILDPYRDALLLALDLGAVCVNVSFDDAGKTLDKHETEAPYGDIPGVGAGRNWAHVNSISYDASDDSIVLSVRHQGVVKIGRDKEVKWILAPSVGWNEALSKKLLTPVDHKGKAINCTNLGKCDGDFDFTYSQHSAWLNDKGTLTVLDNGGGRHYTQPALPSMNYTRFVEYKINPKKMTVEQTWEYGKERGFDWFSPITSNVEYRSDRNTIFGFNGSVKLGEPGARTIGRVNEIDYDTKKVMVEIDMHHEKPNGIHYRGVIINPTTLFSD